MEFSIFFFWCINFKIVARVLYIKLILLHYGSVPSWYDLCQFSCPGSRNPVFWGVSRCKKFPEQILSGFRFCPKSIIFWHFWIWGFLCPGFFPDPGIRILGALSGFLKSINLNSTCYGEFPEAKNFPNKFLFGIQYCSRIRIFWQISSFSFFSINFLLDCYGVL